jgi:signal transduction protein with GAF and PtsI domain
VIATFLGEIEAKLAAGDWNGALAGILNFMRADSGTIHLMGSDGRLHLRCASTGIPQPVLDIVRVVPVGKGMAGLAAERREPVTICNIQTDTSGDVRPGARATGLEGAIALPMFSENLVAGVLGVANRKERTFTAEETEQLLAIGRTLARFV